MALELKHGYKLVNCSNNEVRYLTTESFEKVQTSVYDDNLKQWVTKYNYEQCYFMYDENSDNYFLLSEPVYLG